MNPVADPLLPLLGRLQLTTWRDQRDTLLDDAARRDLNLREALTFFCQAEVARREQRRLEMATRLAQFPWVRTPDDFDFTAQPTLDPKHLRELALCRWVGNGDGVLPLGPPGVGKTHLAVALGRAAIHQGYSVPFTTATALVTGVVKAHSEGHLEERLTHWIKPKLLIIDELGYLPFEPDAAPLFFQRVSHRSERGSLPITGNRSVGEWDQILGAPVVATAILDRLLHHSPVLTLRGESDRLREKRRSGLFKPAPVSSTE